MSFETFAFHPQIAAGILAAGYDTPTPIQTQSIPAILEGRDLMGLAQTGTGKTAAFVLPILQRLLSGPRGKLRVLIIAPTRELAEQTHVAIQTLGRKTGFRSMTIYGGVSAQPQLQGLRAGIEIAVACPGRLLDLMNQRVVNLSAIEILVLDEADQMFDMGFLPTIRKILAALPARRQTLLFSATMPAEIRKLATDLLRRPVAVEIGEPMVGGAPVMRAVPPPLLLHGEEIAEPANEAVARHDAAGEEVLRDPVGAVAGVEAIGRATVAENVEKEHALRGQPGGGALKERAPVRHVLEHLDRDQAIKLTERREAIDVGGNDSEVAQPFGLRPRGDMGALRVGIGDRHDARGAIVPRHPQRERAPAAAELKDALAVGERRVPRRLGERAFLRARKGEPGVRVVAA